MAVNKVEANGETLIDLTNDTAGASDVLEGKTLHLASGAVATGTYRPSDEIEARLRATVGHSNINLFNEKYKQGTSGNLTNTQAVTSKTIIPTTIGQKHIFHNFNQDYAYAIYGLNSAGVSELFSGKNVSTSNRLYDSGYIRQFKYVYENNISGLVAYIIMIRKPQTSGGSDWINITPDSIDQNIIMVTEYPITSDTFVPYQEPTDSLIETKARAYLASTVGHSSKNLLKLETSTKMIDGITYTANEKDGTVTATGTVTTNVIASYYNIDMDLPEGNYYFYGCPTGGAENKYIVFPWDNTTKARPKQWDGTTEAESGYDMTPKQFKTIAGHSLRLTIRICSGHTVNNLVFKPMVWDGSITDDAFEPYQTPTDERFKDYLPIPITLWEAAEEQAPAAAHIPNPDCARYIVTVLLGSGSATTFDIDADYIGKNWQDANCGLSTSVDGDYLNFMLALPPGPFDTIKLVKIVGIPK